MSNHGFKSNILPNHCGNCLWLEWEEDKCECEHPAFIDDDTIMTALTDCNGTQESIEDCLRDTLEEWSENSEWHGYNCICDLHAKKTKNPEDYDRIRSESYKAYLDRVTDLWKQHGFGLR